MSTFKEPGYDAKNYIPEDIDYVLAFTKENWSRLGMTPIYLWRLIERGWDHSEIHGMLCVMIGEDYAEVNTTEWIWRLVMQDIPFDDEMPFIDVLDTFMFHFSSLTSHIPEMTGEVNK